MHVDFTKLHNAYFALRHGESKANREGIILSDPQHGTTGFGLTEEGRAEALRSAEMAKEENLFATPPVIFSSDFLRAKETADIVASVLDVRDVILTSKLRERFFGTWEKTPNSNYQRVWDIDKDDYEHKTEGVESVAEVVERASSLVQEIESQYQGRSVLFVSHGDTLQILQTLFEQVHPSQHRRLTHLKIAEIRSLH